MVSRRTAVIGLGTVIAGGGAVFATGAFTQVEAQREVTVNVVEDGDALVGIEVNERYGGVENGVAEFDLQSGVFEGTGFNPDSTTILYGALAISNNSGIADDVMQVRMSYESDSVTVPTGSEVPGTNHEGQFSFRQFSTANNNPSDPFAGLSYDGSVEDVASAAAIPVGETAVFDLVVDPGGELEPEQDYAVAVTLTAELVPQDD